MNEYVELARDIELAQIQRRLSYVEANSVLHPASGSTWRQIGQGFVLYAGPGSPVNRAMGLGLGTPVSEAEIKAVEDFYHELDEPARIDLCPLSDEGLFKMLGASGYTVAQMDDVLYLRLPSGPVSPGDSPSAIRQVSDENRGTFIDVLTASFCSNESEAAAIRGLFEPSAYSRFFTGFLAYSNGEPVAAGGLYYRDNLAEMAPDGTLPAYRRRGLQSLLMRHRIDYAGYAGCRLLVTTCAPGVATRKNAEMLGFRLAYNKTVVVKAAKMV